MEQSRLSQLVTAAGFILFTPILSPFQSGRFEQLKSQGIAFVQEEQYDKGAGKLEEIWEQDKSDGTIGEYLALAYLNTEEKRMLQKYQLQAFAIIQRLADGGQKVSFMVVHSHEKMGWLQGRALNQYCRGHLSILPGRVSYVAQKGEKAGQHSFEASSEVLKRVSLNEEDGRGTFSIEAKNLNYFMATRNRNRDEARVIVDLIRRQTGISKR